EAVCGGALGKDDFFLASAAEQEQYKLKRAAWEEKTKEMREQIARVEAPILKAIYDENFYKYPADIQAAVNTPPEKRDTMQWLMYHKASWLLDSKQDEDGNGVRNRLKGDARKQYDEMRAKLAAFDNIKPAPLPIGSGITDVGPNAPATNVLNKG